MNDVLNGLKKIVDESRARMKRDKRTFDTLDENTCMLCGAHGEDKRSWQSSCFYAIHEMIPEALDLEEGYYLRICKCCRGRYLEHLSQWRDECVSLRERPKDHDGYLEDEGLEEGRDVPVRENGVIVYLTREEWDERNRSKEGK